MAEPENLAVFTRWAKYAHAPHPLYDHLLAQAEGHLRQRSAEIADMRTPADWLKRQEKLRATLMELVGPFPQRTPLNARISGIVPKDGYHIEKLIYESRPGFYVTSCLLVPEGLRGKVPAVLYLIGHSDDGFRSMYSQTILLNLVKKGFVVMTIDPLGQGERVQYYDAEIGRSRIGTCTAEHSYVGEQCFIAGSNLARYRIWDGMRAIDYLCSRDEVDGARIGVSGCSGGGTATTYLSAFDERVLVSAPANYICGFGRLLESIGPQDAEQNFNRGVSSHIDHADMLAVRAPKPALIQATTRDFFSIQGARESFAEVQQIYRALGAADALRIVEDDHPHGTTPKIRRVLYAFFQEYLEHPGSPEEEMDSLSPEDMRVTETGQVLTSLGGETVFTINRKETEPLLQNLAESRGNPKKHLASAVASARSLSGYVAPEGTQEAVFTGRYPREGYCVEKYMLQGEGEYVIPFLLLVPAQGTKHPALLYLNPQGKAAEAQPDGEMERFVRQGYAVLAPDLVGVGEAAGAAVSRRGRESFFVQNDRFVSFAALLVGRSVVGVHAGDIVRLVRYLESREDIEQGQIAALGRGALCPALLHAAAFSEAVSKVALIEPLISYRSVVMNRFYETAFSSAVPGALTGYDLPDLAASLAPRRLLMVNVLDQNGTQAGADLIQEDLAVVRSAYAEAGAESRLGIQSRAVWEGAEDLLADWLK